MKDEYISSLVGRAVQVYKGGPDSNNGVLLDVNDDYLTLQKEDGHIIYYKTAHIKSIRENSQIRFNSILKVYDTNNLHKAATFNELVVNFKEQTIRINGNGPESKVGKLIDVKEDFFVLYTEEDGLIFYKEQHIKSLSHNLTSTNQVIDKDNETLVDNSSNEDVIPEELTNTVTNIMEVYNQISADNTINLLTNLKLSWIKINRKGPESIEGLLVEANENYLVLIVNNEIFRIPTYHVKNFSVSINKSQEQTNEQNTNENLEGNENIKTTNETSVETNDQDSINEKVTFDEELNQAIKRKNKHMKKKARQQKQQSNSTKAQSPEKNPEGQQNTEKPHREESTNTRPTNTVNRRKKQGSNQPKKSLVEKYRKNKKK
ncbi:DUF6897 domain-containing protein [Paenisporosarcina antarctica]|uniref:DUF2642 domain-containing protein n=1 Tax=Paenisporosarcina antarctica TaxID=417367 RepID=A0A4P7A428_9BACL|nr:hypothetical protein [Paenisporosarcina antarctica]QBP42856.1 hypothetical protein E2636_17680 [Paenisporosarcina antarctica]